MESRITETGGRSEFASRFNHLLKRITGGAVAMVMMLCAVNIAVAQSQPSTTRSAPSTRVAAPVEDNALQQELARATRLARQAESDSEWEKALGIWLFVWEKRPGDYSAYSGLRRCYLQLKRYDEGLEFLRRALVEARKTKGYFEPSFVAADYVDMLLAADRQDSAKKVIDSMLKEFKGNPSIYRNLSNTLFSKRMSEEAMQLLRQGRKESGNPFMFAQEMAYQAEARMDWGTATTEYINYIKESSDRLSYITGVVGDFCRDAESEAIVFGVINRELARAEQGFATTLRRLKAGLYFRLKRYEDALKIYSEITDGRDEDSNDMFEFARQLTVEKEWRLALEAYSLMNERSPAQSLRARILIGQGDCFAALDQPDSALGAYNAVLEAGSQPESLVTAYQRMGEILMMVKREPRVARERFESALSIMRKGKFAQGDIDDVSIAIGLTYELEENTRAAQTEFERIIRSAGSRVSGAPRARYELAMVLFRQGNPIRARQEAAALMSADPSSEFANDALTLMSLIDGLQNDSLTLALFGKANYLYFLSRYDEAVAILNELTASKSARAVEEALWRLVEIDLARNQYRSATANLERIIELDNRALRGDKALFVAGSIYFRQLGDGAHAERYLEDLLSRFPDSPLADQARRLLRTIIEPTL